MALTYYFWHTYFLIYLWTLIFSKFALQGLLQVILQPGKKLDTKWDPDGEVMAL